LANQMSTLPAVDLGMNGASPMKAKSVCAGDYFSCAHTETDQVKCWGRNDFGQLGQESIIPKGYQAGDMASLPFTNLGTGLTVKKLSCHYLNACALLSNDKLKCWGNGSSGQLGLGNNANRGNLGSSMGDALPFINLGTDRTVIDVSVGVNYVCAVLDNNDVKCWGHNYRGQLGQGHGNYIGDNPDEMGDNLLPINF